MTFLLRVLPAPAAFLALACLSAPGARAAPAQAFRGFLESEASPMIFLPAGTGMTLAYDVRGGSLFLAWKGRAEPVPGPGGGYRAAGTVYHRRASAYPWSVRGPKGILPVTVALKGLKSRGSLAVLEWELGLPGGRKVRVTELPRYDDHYGDPGLFREFEVAGLPEGMALRLDLTGTGLPESWGGGGDGALAEEDGRRLLVQSRDGTTPLKVNWSDHPASGDPALGGGWR
jgi:hypothetical protein